MNKLLIVLFFVLLLSSVVVAEQLKSWPAPVKNVKSVMRDVKKSAYSRIQRVDTFMVRRVPAVNDAVKPRVVYGNWRAPKTLHTTVPVSSSREKKSLFLY